MKFENKINIQNKKARFNFELLEKYEAGIQLFGTEIKSIRQSKASISESFCQFKGDELFVINMLINEYELGTHYNHKAKRDRKLLLNRKELNKLLRKTKESSLTIVPTTLYISDKGFAKIVIYLAKGKKLFDKRNSLKEKDLKRDLVRLKKNQ